MPHNGLLQELEQDVERLVLDATYVPYMHASLRSRLTISALALEQALANAVQATSRWDTAAV